MNRVLGEKKAYWIGGTLTGLLGIALVRLVAPELAGVAGAVAAGVGYTLVIVAITTFGLATRRAKAEAFLTLDKKTG